MVAAGLPVVVLCCSCTAPAQMPHRRCSLPPVVPVVSIEGPGVTIPTRRQVQEANVARGAKVKVTLEQGFLVPISSNDAVLKRISTATTSGPYCFQLVETTFVARSKGVAMVAAFDPPPPGSERAVQIFRLRVTVWGDIGNTVGS